MLGIDSRFVKKLHLLRPGPKQAAHGKFLAGYARKNSRVFP